MTSTNNSRTTQTPPARSRHRLSHSPASAPTPRPNISKRHISARLTTLAVPGPAIPIGCTQPCLAAPVRSPPVRPVHPATRAPATHPFERRPPTPSPSPRELTPSCPAITPNAPQVDTGGKTRREQRKRRTATGAAPGGNSAPKNRPARQRRSPDNYRHRHATPRGNNRHLPGQHQGTQPGTHGTIANQPCPYRTARTIGPVIDGIDGMNFRYRPATADNPQAAGTTLDAALARVLDGIDQFQRCATLTAPDMPLEAQPRGKALLIALSPGTVRVIGAGELAQTLRSRLDDGFHGWRTPLPPASRTPLYTLRGHLPPKTYNLLDRNGFATVEELRDIPDNAWLELRGAGQAFLDTLHHLLDTPPEPSANPDPVPNAAHHGWRLHVDPDGHTATLHTPGPIAITELTGTTVQLTRTDVPTGSDQASPSIASGTGDFWTVDLAEEILRGARPHGSTFLRALIDAGGTATAEHLRHATELDELRAATQTLTTSAARILGRRIPEGRKHRHFFTARPHPERPQDARVHDYYLPSPPREQFDQALQRLGR